MNMMQPDRLPDGALSGAGAAPADDEVFVIPMSFAQQRLWFLDQFQPGSPFYNIPSAIRLTGRLNAEALGRALNEIVARHEALRTTFRAVRGEPMQIIAPRLTLDAPLVDLQPLPQAEREAEALRLAQAEARQPFDLSRGPLLRARLIRLGEADHLALITMHHIISDGWSMGVFVRELGILYDAFNRGEAASPLPDLPIQYADYAEWQREWLQGEVLERHFAYWQERLGDAPPVLELPTDRPRPPVQTANGASLDTKLPRALADRLNELSRREGATLFMTLLAAFKVLLYRYTGLADICVGTPIANRTRAELEGLIGIFINTLVLRTDLSREPTFRELLRRVREIALGAYAHQDLPFEMLVDRLQPDRDMSHSTLFQVMFILQNAGVRAQQVPGLALQVVDADAGTATFDLTLNITEQTDGLSTSVEYNTDLFDRSTIERLLGHYHTLLEAIVADPDRAITRLPLLTEAERRRMLVDWNRSEADFDLSRGIHALIEAQAAATPDATAVVAPLAQPSGGAAPSVSTLTYRELNARANQLAHHLRAMGVGPETLVAIGAEKSVEMIVGLLGILKAGGAYLPIDPSYPAERIQHMLSDSGAQVLVTQERVLGNFRFESGIVRLDTDWPTIARRPTTNLPIEQSTNHLAYVIYTSGSTGQSKGVMVEHRQLVNAYLAWEQAYALRAPVKTHLQMASFSFDVFTGDLVRGLCSGGTLVLAPRELLLEPDRLYALMRRHAVTCGEFVPGVLRPLIQYLEETGQDLSFMEVLACGSDSWYVGEYRRFLRFCGPGTRLINSFGLTEATIDTCYFEASIASASTSDLGCLAQDQIVPIGKPFANQRMVILDRYGQPVPAGIPGELYVGGLGVTRGYLGRPELTAEKFVPDPFAGVRSQESGVRGLASDPRLYRTGDLARYLADGNVQFLGRADFQVKIRGYRVEPGEIEAVLDRQPALGGCAIVARPDPKGNPRLVAYFVVKRGVSADEMPSAGVLRRFVQERLPDYMVPSVFVPLDRLPLTPNGKIDRAALPAPDWSQRGAEDTYVAPRTPLERQVADIWTEVLGVERVGAFDNFFELGGHSLLATQLVSRLRKTFDIELPLRNIFESPTVASLAEQISAGRGAPTALAPAEAPPIVPVPRGDEIPLSFAQQRLWFLDQLEPNSPFYNIPESVRLTGPLDADVLRRTLNELIRRHESLRTRFGSRDGRPHQAITPSLTADLPVEDLTALSEAEREAAVQRLATEEAQRPFDLTVAPLMRARLLRLGPRDHVFLLTTHHIVSDNWSSNVLVREMAVLYDAFRHGRPSPLPPLPIQYADFAHWQRTWLEGVPAGEETSPLQRQLAYWKQQLAGATPLLELPTDRPRPAVQTFRGAYLTFDLGRELSAGLLNLSQQEGVTPFMALLAAFQTLLARYSGQDDISVGSPIANRTRAEMEGIIGFFVNTLVLHTRLDGDPTFRELLTRTRETALGAYAHQDVPFEMLVEALQPQRNLSHSPLFQVMFALQNMPPLRLQAGADDGLSISPVSAHSGTSKFDLTLFMIESGERLSGALEYNTDLFDDATIERLAEHFRTLLGGIVADPDQRLSALPLLTEAERRYLLVEWNRTQADFPADKLAHQLIEEQACRTPDAIAVKVKAEAERNSALTYRELDERANQLAHYLRGLGIGPDTIVAICMERVLELPIAILGTLKAGGAYLPIDPTYPADRIRYMLEDSGARVVLTQERVLASGNWKLEAGSQELAIVRLDTDWPSIARQPTTNLPIYPSTHLPASNSLAYVIYTSGSTGRPKGTMIHHRGLVNYLTWCQRAYPLAGGIGAPVHSSISFDLTVTSLIAPLAAGRTAYLAPESSGIEALTDALRADADFSLVKITPAHLELVGQQLQPAEAAGRTRAFVIGGEQLLAEHVAFWQRHAPDTLLINEYGPTETVVGCCVFTADGRTPLRGAVPIGRPIINTQLYVLDRHLNPVPQGVPGELYIGGEGVARGYLGRPELTAERFVPDPFAEVRGQGSGSRSQGSEISSPTSDLRSPTSGSRLYRTGDLVRLRADGELEFLGRVDDQVKIRGFRIELGEIEAVLAAQPGVREVAVIVREIAAGDRRLAAYVAFDPGSAVSAADLRQALSRKLPDYMIPAAFVVLDVLPLTPNGKVDRKALARTEGPALDLGGAAGEAFVAPSSPTEEILAGIWADLLRIERVGASDNFFDLGGHSLLATQLMSRIRGAFGVELPLRALFETPTVTGLAGAIDTAAASARQMQAPPLIPVPRLPADGDRATEILPLSFGQQRLWFLDKLEPGNPFYNIPSAIRLPGELNIAALVHSLNEVVRRHEVLRTTFAEIGGKPTQVVLAEQRIALPLIDLSGQAQAVREAELRRLAEQEAQQPFDLARGPLLRARLLRMADDAEAEHVLLLTMHHIVSDAWSNSILVAEMAEFYAAYIADRAAVLPPLPIQYADYAAWQRAWLADTGEATSPLRRQLAFWRAQLAGLPPLLELPTDRPRPAVQSYRGAQRTFALPPDISAALNALARREGATPFMVLLAAFQTLLHRYTAQDTIAIGTPIANRTRGETEGLIGFFINTLVMAGDLSGNPTFRELLQRVRETALGAYAHQDLPFEALVDHLQPERSLSYSPLFQVMFVMQNAAQAAARRGSQSMPGLMLAPIELPSSTSPFDMTLSMAEGSDGFSGAWEYNLDLFDQTTIDRMIGHFCTLLTHIAAAPNERIGDLPLLTEAESAQLVAWNRTETPFPVDRTVAQLFEEQALRTPDAHAIVFVGQMPESGKSGQAASLSSTLTYRELDARANQLAHHLRNLGVGPDTIVGIAIDRSPEMIVGLLGILKAGGAYLPLDPAYPADRLAYMMEDSGIQVLVTQERALASENWKLEAGSQELAIVRLDTDWPSIARQPTTNLPIYQSTHLPASDSLVYLIYTSGTTGRPKGVMVQHRGLTNLVTAQTQAFEVDETHRVLQFASFSFDAAASEIFMALTTGAALYLAPRETLASLPDLARLLRERDITTITLPPSVLALLPTDGLDGLHTLITAGERCGADVAAKWAPGRKLFNAYGPTEASIGPTLGRVTELPASAASAPIGRPIANTQIHILDRYGHPTPVGVPGELCVGGVGVARGYLGRPELTAEKFVPNPFAEVRGQGSGGRGQGAEISSPTSDLRSRNSGSRLYRTGDLARYLPDGRIEILGRIDQQVKLRGFRIELGEIEAALREHPAVREAAVIVRGETLAAFVVGADESRPSAATLREALRGRLPDYMIPSAFVTLETLPLTPNGKIDRRALAAWKIDRPTDEAAYTAPRTPTEEVLAGLWSDLLHTERIGVDDNFFELGGHSLLATQLMSRVREAFGVELPLRTLFEAPSLAGLAQAIDTAAQTARGSAAPPLTAIPRDPGGAGLPLEAPPLSFAQQRLWFLDQLEPDSPLYNLPTAVRLQGELDVAALRRALAALLLRHESLRTTFTAVDGEGQQMIAAIGSLAEAEALIALPVVDLGMLPDAAAQEAEVARLAAEEARAPFRLDGTTARTLLRVRLLRLAAADHVALLTMHHIVSDGWSMGVLVRELAALYAAFRENELASMDQAVRAAGLRPLPVQYADFAAWQRAWLQGEALQAQIDYWKTELAGTPPLLELPTDRLRPPVPSYRGATLDFVLPADLTDRLRAVSRAAGATLFMTLLAAFQALLHRYTGQPDINVGVPIAGRTRAETEGLIGFFVNTLVLRGRLAGNPAFRELLGRVREAALGAYAHQDLPFETLVDAVAPVRAMSHSPLFQVVFTMQNQPLGGMALPDLRLTPVPADAGIAKFDLTLSMLENTGPGGGLSGALEYATDLFDEATVARMAGHFRTLLEAIAADPAQRIGDLPLLTAAERRQILEDWTATAAPFPADRCVHELFAEQAARTPDAIALEFVNSAEANGASTSTLTYRELNERANQLAHHLRSLGVGPETIVGISIARSPELVIGLLGILKAGGAYLPLDPAYPPDRIRFMIEDSGIQVLLAQERLLETESWKLEAGSRRLAIVRLDTDWPTLARQPTTNLPIYQSTSHLAYVIYTSGSTGRPKGVMVPHAGLTNLVLAQIAGFRVWPESRVLQFASFSFDACVSETFMALLSGATLVLAPQPVLASVPDLARLLRAQRISVVTLPPSVLSVLPEEGLEGLTSLISAGERCPADLARRWTHGRHFVNAYGPTEATIGPTLHPVTALPAGLSSAPIGRPIQNMRIYLFDRYGQPVPIGVPGEVHIGGIGVARGYLGRPELTAEKFVPNPFAEVRSPTSGSRLYRTGDLARWLPDGNLEYLGRVDFQVKVRGFRIELGEIESVLRTHPGLAEAVVLTRPDASGDSRLLAFILRPPVADADVTPASLREHLRASLPEYMLPAAFVTVEAMPLTPNGKIDRRALADLPEPGREGAATEYVEPRDLLEAQLVQIWQEVLGVTSVGVRDSFFDLGGHSLLAVKLIARIGSELGVNVPLVALFQEPTVEHLAGVLREQYLGAFASPLVPLKPDGSRPPLFMIHPSGGSVHWYQDLAGQMPDDQPVYGLQARGLMGDEELDTTIEAMAARYVAEIRRVQPAGPYRLGSWSMGVVIALEAAQQLRDQGQEVGLLAMLDQGPYQPDVAPADDAEYLITFFGRRMPVEVDFLRTLEPDVQLEYVMAEAKRIGWMFQDVSLAQFKHFVTILKTHEHAWRSYQPQPYAGKVTLYRATETQHPEPAPDLGWGQIALAGVDVDEVPGDHNTMLHEPNLVTLVQRLNVNLGPKAKSS